MALKIEKKQVVGKTSVQKKYGTDEEDPVETEEVIDEVLTTQEMANVGLSVGYTKNLGNYNSAKIQVSLHIPCVHDSDIIDSTFEEITEWVNKKMSELAEDL